MDAYLISINQKQFKSAISSICKEPIFVSSLRVGNPEHSEKQLSKLSFVQEFVVQELGFDQNFQRTNQLWSTEKKPEFALISIPHSSPSNFDKAGYELLKKALVSKSNRSEQFPIKSNQEFPIDDLYGTLNLVKIKLNNEINFQKKIDLNFLGFGLSEEAIGIAAFSSDFILQAHPAANEETMTTLTEHYSTVMPKIHSDNISDFFTRLATIAFTPQEKCHINFITRLFMNIQHSQIKKLIAETNTAKLPELLGTPRQIIYATNIRMNRMREFGASDILVKTVTNSAEWIECHKRNQLKHVKPSLMNKYFMN